jgi:SOS-response transcriptional repressor LexA/DNA-binding XRE family transcriptional regulator
MSKAIGKRLKTARKQLGLSQAAMAAELGLPQSTLADYELDRYAIPHDVCLAIEYKFGINHDWVLTGKGEQFLAAEPRTGGAAPVLRPVIVTGKAELERLEQLEGRDRYYAIPYLRDAAAAGTGRIVEDEVEGYCIIHERVAPRPQNLRCVRVSGDSMSPALTDGSIVAVDITRRNPKQLEGRIVCARVSEDEVVLKRLRLRGRYALLFSDNEDQHKYPPIVVDMSERPDLLIGQVVWAWVDLR